MAAPSPRGADPTGPKALAMLAYLPLLTLALWLLERAQPHVLLRYHVRHALILQAAWGLGFGLLLLLSQLQPAEPGLGSLWWQMVLGLVITLGGAAYLAVGGYLAAGAFQGRYPVLPLVTGLVYRWDAAAGG